MQEFYEKHTCSTNSSNKSNLTMKTSMFCMEIQHARLENNLLLICPFSSKNLTNEQFMLNRSMSPLRQGVEWSFGKIVNEFAFLDFKKIQKLQDLGKMYKAAALLTSCHTCLYGSQILHVF